MNYHDIEGCEPLNEVDAAKVARIRASILADGWRGAPILVCADDGVLVTGSHRLAALGAIADDEATWDSPVLDDESVAYDVTDIINAYCGEHDCTSDDIDYALLGPVLAGTPVERWADDIVEW